MVVSVLVCDEWINFDFLFCSLLVVRISVLTLKLQLGVSFSFQLRFRCFNSRFQGFSNELCNGGVIFTFGERIDIE